MTRLIDADELHEIINWTHMKPPFSKKAIHRFIDMARTVEAGPVRHGHWIKQNDGCVRPFWESYICSECRCKSGDTVYCCSCGAKMDGEREEE